MKLFNSKAMVTFAKTSPGFYWQVNFDINTGHYTVETDQYFSTPVECQSDWEEFAKENEIINYELDWSSL